MRTVVSIKAPLAEAWGARDDVGRDEEGTVRVMPNTRDPEIGTMCWAQCVVCVQGHKLGAQATSAKVGGHKVLQWHVVDMYQ